MFVGVDAVDEGPVDAVLSASLALSRSAWVKEHILPHEPALRTWLSWKLKGRREVDDVVQDVYLRLFQTESVAHVRTPKYYLWRTAYSVVSDRGRRQKFAPVALDEDLHMQHLIDRATPAQLIEDREQLSLVMILLNELPAKTRDVLMLRRVDGLSGRAIAARLGMSLSSVEKHQTRAHRYLLRRRATLG